jgi:hypothetical protein
MSLVMLPESCEWFTAKEYLHRQERERVLDFALRGWHLETNGSVTPGAIDGKYAKLVKTGRGKAQRPYHIYDQSHADAVKRIDGIKRLSFANGVSVYGYR